LTAFFFIAPPRLLRRNPLFALRLPSLLRELSPHLFLPLPFLFFCELPLFFIVFFIFFFQNKKKTFVWGFLGPPRSRPSPLFGFQSMMISLVCLVFRPSFPCPHMTFGVCPDLLCFPTKCECFVHSFFFINRPVIFLFAWRFGFVVFVRDPVYEALVLPGSFLFLTPEPHHFSLLQACDGGSSVPPPPNCSLSPRSRRTLAYVG